MRCVSELPLSDNRVAVVTGGSGSIGRGVADALMGAGSRVVILDNSSHALSGCTPQGDRGPFTYEVDVSDPNQVKGAMARAAGALGGIDVLVHCAGILGPSGPLEDMLPAALEDVVRSNLQGGIASSAAVLPHMKARGGGSIVLLSSIVAHTGSSPSPVYSAAKAGLIGFARGLAKQVGRHQIRVNCVSPGSVSDSRLLHNARGYGLTSSEAIGLLAKLPLAQMVRVQDIATAVLFLCSDQASRITGIDLIVEAGESLRAD